MNTMIAKIIHISISRHWHDVYEFAYKPENMPRWASGLANGLTQEGEDWIADGGPIGKVRVRYAPSNSLGVIDHSVTMPDGSVVYNALRATPNGDGAEVAFTLLRGPNMDDSQFAADAQHVQRDLETLKALLESEPE